MQLLGISMIFLMIIWVEVPKMLSKKMWRELITFSFLMGFGMAMTYAYILDLPVPIPTYAIEKIFKPFKTVVEKILL